MKTKINRLLDEELEWAESQPLPAPEDALGDVYAEDDKAQAVKI